MVIPTLGSLLLLLCSLTLSHSPSVHLTPSFSLFLHHSSHYSLMKVGALTENSRSLLSIFALSDVVTCKTSKTTTLLGPMESYSFLLLELTLTAHWVECN